MKKVVVIFALIVIILGGAAALLSIIQSRATNAVTLELNEDLKQARIQAAKSLVFEEAALKRAKLQTAIRREWMAADALLFFQSVKQYGLVLSLGVMLSMMIVVGLAFGKRLTTVYAELEEHVKIPIRHKDLKDSSGHVTAFLAMKEGIVHAESQQQAFEMAAQMMQLATSFNRALPKVQSMEVGAALAAPSAPAANPLPAFREILDSLEPGDPMVLGFDAGTMAPITGGFERIYSCGIFGLSGSGKTTGLYSIIAQSLLLFPAIRYTVIDPHADRPEGLTKGLPRTGHFEHLDHLNVRPGLTRFIEELDRRLKSAEDYRLAPRVLLIDELPVLMRSSQGQAVEAVLGRIAAEGRKVACYALISGQDTRLKSAGGDRDLLTSQIAYNLRKKQARYLFDDSDIVELHRIVREAKQPGLCVFSATDAEPVLMRQPLCTAADVKYVTGIVGRMDFEDAKAVEVSAHVTEEMQAESGETGGEAVTGDGPGEIHPFQGDVLWQQLAAYLQGKDHSLTKLGKISGVNKGLLSLFCNGNRALSEENRVKLQRTFDAVSPVVTNETASNVIPFERKKIEGV